MTQYVSILFMFAALGVLSGCESFDPGSLIAGPRVLGARIEVQGEPARATPKPEESAEIRWITVSPREPQSLAWAFVACLPEAAADGSCASAPLAFEEGSGVAPRLTLRVPDEASLGDAHSVQVFGLICDRGTPALSEHAPPHCAGEDAHGTTVRLEVTLERAERGNLNPELEGAYVALDGRAWDNETTAGELTGCEADTALPQLKADGKKHVITLELGPEVRELYNEPASGRSELEELQLSHFATAGELSGQYSFVEASDPSERPELSVDWRAPDAEEVAPDGERVRFLFVLRDLRGGLAVSERSLCAVR